MESAPVCPHHFIDFTSLSLTHYQVSRRQASPFLPSLHVTLRTPGNESSCLSNQRVPANCAINVPAHDPADTCPHAPAAPRPCVPCGSPKLPWRHSCAASPADGPATGGGYPPALRRPGAPRNGRHAPAGCAHTGHRAC